MNASGRRAVLALFVVVGLLVGTPLAEAAAPRPEARSTWHLVDYAQRACFDTHVTDSYFGIYVRGRWDHALNVGARRLPSGGGFNTSYAPIPPGSSSGEYSLAYVHVMLAPATPIGVYTAVMWASDGTRSQGVPIVLDVRSTCGY